jgi:thioredoxin reductase
MNKNYSPAREPFDVIIIGGGPAGLNGALILARSRRSVVVIDSGAPRNAPAKAIHGLLGHEGTPPQELLRIGREELQRYGAQIVEGEVVNANRDSDLLAVTLSSGQQMFSRRLLVATGVSDRLPNIAGLAERWGHDVVHCPYCHGWEVRDRVIGVLQTGPASLHQALLFRQLSESIVFFTNGMELEQEHLEELQARSVKIVQGAVAAVEVSQDAIVGLRLEESRFQSCEVVAVATRMEAHAAFMARLGLIPDEHSAGFGHYIPADGLGRTSIPGVWVAGNITDLSAQVGGAAAAGALAGAQINAELVREETDRALEDFRSSERSCSEVT